MCGFPDLKIQWLEGKTKLGCRKTKTLHSDNYSVCGEKTDGEICFVNIHQICRAVNHCGSNKLLPRLKGENDGRRSRQY